MQNQAFMPTEKKGVSSSINEEVEESSNSSGSSENNQSEHAGDD